NPVGHFPFTVDGPVRARCSPRRRFTVSLMSRGTLSLALVIALCPSGRAGDDSTPPKTREFHFTYQATVTGLQPGQKARIWLPVPPSNADQDVSVVERHAPTKPQVGKERVYGNQIQYVEAAADAAGRVPLSVTYRVRRKEIKADRKGSGGEAVDVA